MKYLWKLPSTGFRNLLVDWEVFGFLARLKIVETRFLYRLFYGHPFRSLKQRLVRLAYRQAAQIWTKMSSGARVNVGAVSTVTKTRPEPSREQILDMNGTLPIIFIHGSNSDYLKYSLAQAKASNPKSSVFLLGDASNNVYDFVEHHSMDDVCRKPAGSAEGEKEIRACV